MYKENFLAPPLNRVENFPLGEQNYDKIPDKIKIVVYKMYALSYTGTVLLQYPTVIDCVAICVGCNKPSSPYY